MGFLLSKQRKDGCWGSLFRLDLALVIMGHSGGCRSARAGNDLRADQIGPASCSKARGRVLGHPRLAEASAKGRAVTAGVAKRFAENLMPAIREIKAAGTTSNVAIAAKLNERKIPTARGGRRAHVQIGASWRGRWGKLRAPSRAIWPLPRFSRRWPLLLLYRCRARLFEPRGPV
jgi:hypothetical protein